MAKTGRRTFREKLADYERNPKRWELISSHSDKASRKGARRQGTSIQQVYRHQGTKELIVRHTVVDDGGRIVDDHFRPEYKPRQGDLNDSLEETF